MQEAEKESYTNLYAAGRHDMIPFRECSEISCGFKLNVMLNNAWARLQPCDKVKSFPSDWDEEKMKET